MALVLTVSIQQLPAMQQLVLRETSCLPGNSRAHESNNQGILAFTAILLCAVGGGSKVAIHSSAIP